MGDGRKSQAKKRPVGELRIEDQRRQMPQWLPALST